MRAALIPALAALAACAAPKPEPVAPPPPPEPPAANAIRLGAPMSMARTRVERLAASCWLDNELAAEIMVVDRQTGEIVAAGAEGELLRIAFAAAGPVDTDVSLSGPALTDSARAARMENALARALEGAEPAC